MHVNLVPIHPTIADPACIWDPASISENTVDLYGYTILVIKILIYESMINCKLAMMSFASIVLVDYKILLFRLMWNTFAAI